MERVEDKGGTDGGLGLTLMLLKGGGGEEGDNKAD